MADEKHIDERTPEEKREQDRRSKQFDSLSTAFKDGHKRSNQSHAEEKGKQE